MESFCVELVTDVLPFDLEGIAAVEGLQREAGMTGEGGGDGA